MPPTPYHAISLGWSASAGSQSSQPHLGDGTTYHPLRPTSLALDGTAALRLDFDDAVEVEDGEEGMLTWGVCERPWSAGDMLMLRINRSGPDLTGATNDTDCP